MYDDLEIKLFTLILVSFASMLPLFTKSNSYTILSPGLFKLTSIPEIAVPVNCGVPLTSAVPVFFR